MACCNLSLSRAVWAIVASNEFKLVKPLCVPTRLDVYLQKIFYREKKNKSQMSLKENSSPRVIIFIIRCSPWTIKFGLTSWPIPGLPSWVRPYSTKGERENFVSLSKANVGKTVALIGWQVSCVMTSPAISQN